MTTKTKKPAKNAEKNFDPLMEVLFQVLPDMKTMDMENDDSYDTGEGFDTDDTDFIHSCVLRLIWLATNEDDDFSWNKNESISCSIKDNSIYRLSVDFDYLELKGTITLETTIDGTNEFKDAYINVRHYSSDFDTKNEMTTHFTSISEVMKIIKSNVNTLRKKCLLAAAKKYGLKLR
jgi:hypothetical protein